MPVIIQGGMGMGVSNWVLARAVSQLGHLGVVSGTAIDTALVRRLQDGDPGGHMRRALNYFPFPDAAEKIVKAFYIPGGKPPRQRYRNIGLYTLHPSRGKLELTVVANFVEVFLTKEGHEGLVGINLLQKIQLPNLPSLYGAMLAGVDYVLMGAGIPREVPGALDLMAKHEAVRVRIPVDGAGPEEIYEFEFDPVAVFRKKLLPLKRPDFLPIIASSTLAISLARKSHGAIQGFIVEGPLAGGHNAPPRGALQLNERGEPLYGPRDEVDLTKIVELGLPFWLAGSFADPERLAWARAQGAAGIQVGTAFAFCRESGIQDAIKREVLRMAREGTVDVFSDPTASPTGFPFKVVGLRGSISEKEEYGKRPRICDLGYLRTLYKTPEGEIGYRCASEPVEAYTRKGGKVEDTAGRKCLCNSLQATIGLGQYQANGYLEPPLLTSGEDVKRIARFLRPGQDSYSAKDVIDYISSADSRYPSSSTVLTH